MDQEKELELGDTKAFVLVKQTLFFARPQLLEQRCWGKTDRLAACKLNDLGKFLPLPGVLVLIYTWWGRTTSVLLVLSISSINSLSSHNSTPISLGTPFLTLCPCEAYGANSILGSRGGQSPQLACSASFLCPPRLVQGWPAPQANQ